MKSLTEWIPETKCETLRGSMGNPAVLTYEIDYLKLNSLLNPAIKINSFCLNQAALLERFCGGSILQHAYRQKAHMGSDFQPFSLTASVQIMRCSRGLLSFFEDCYRQLGACGSYMTRVSRSFSLTDGQPVALSSLFLSHANWQTLLFRLLEDEVKARMENDPGSYYKNAASLMRRRLSSHSYYLADDGLAIWFPQNAIAPANTGLPTFFIPYVRMQSILKRNL